MNDSIELEISIEKKYQQLSSWYMLLLYFFLGIFLPYKYNLIHQNIFFPLFGLLGIISAFAIFKFIEIWIRAVDSRLYVDPKTRNQWIYGWLISGILVIWYLISGQNWVFIFVGVFCFIAIFSILFAAVIVATENIASYFNTLFYWLNKNDPTNLIRMGWLNLLNKLNEHKTNLGFVRLNKSIIFIDDKIHGLQALSWNDSGDFMFRKRESLEQFVNSFNPDIEFKIEPFDITQFMEESTKKTISDLLHIRFGSTKSIFSITYPTSDFSSNYIVYFKLSRAKTLFLGYTVGH
jgi:hypothetical protein